MNIPLHQGRGFSSKDRLEGQAVAVVGSRLAEHMWPSGDAIGRRLKLGPPESDAPWLTVVGRVGDLRSVSRSGEAALDLYVSQ